MALGWCYRLDNAFDVEASMQGFVKLINLAFDAGGGGSESLRGQALVDVTEKTKTSVQGAECLQVRVCADRSGGIVSLVVGRDAAVGELK